MDVLALFADRKFYEEGGKRHKKRHPLDGRKPKRKKLRKVKARTYVEERPKYSAWMHAFPGCDPDAG